MRKQSERERERQKGDRRVERERGKDTNTSTGTGSLIFHGFWRALPLFCPPPPQKKKKKKKKKKQVSSNLLPERTQNGTFLTSLLTTDLGMSHLGPALMKFYVGA